MLQQNITVRTKITRVMISVNVNRQRSSDISVIKENVFCPARTCAHGPVIFSIQEIESGDVPNMTLPGYGASHRA